MNPAIFVDKDGTLIKDVSYNADPKLVELTPGSELLAEMHRRGYLIVVVSNQPGVAFGYFKEEALSGIKSKIEELLARVGAPLAGFYFCPHHPVAPVRRYRKPCDCRKPASGMFLKAAEELNLDLDRSWVIGDILDDIEAGQRVGCRGVLLDNGNETEWRIESPVRKPAFVAADLAEAMQVVLNKARRAA